jgi:hypothetical protein
MSESSRWKAPLWGFVGLIVGLTLGSGILFRNYFGNHPTGPGGGIQGFSIGVAELAVLAGAVFWIAFWVLLIAGLVRFVRHGRTWYRGRLEDLPADFDDWHRRAHERMREAAAADDSGRRG